MRLNTPLKNKRQNYQNPEKLKIFPYPIYTTGVSYAYNLLHTAAGHRPDVTVIQHDLPMGKTRHFSATDKTGASACCLAERPD